MNWLITTLIVGISAAFATTFDDNLYLTAFFGKVNHAFRPKHIILGEFVGFTALVLASLPGFFGGLVLPASWIGLLGFLPIAIGISHLLSRDDGDEAVESIAVNLSSSPTRSKRHKNHSWQLSAILKPIECPQ